MVCDSNFSSAKVFVCERVSQIKRSAVSDLYRLYACSTFISEKGR